MIHGMLAQTIGVILSIAIVSIATAVSIAIMIIAIPTLSMTIARVASTAIKRSYH